MRRNFVLFYLYFLIIEEIFMHYSIVKLGKTYIFKSHSYRMFRLSNVITTIIPFFNFFLMIILFRWVFEFQFQCKCRENTCIGILFCNSNNLFFSLLVIWDFFFLCINVFVSSSLYYFVKKNLKVVIIIECSTCKLFNLRHFIDDSTDFIAQFDENHWFD